MRQLLSIIAVSAIAGLSFAQTNFTGDVLNGVRVISSLNLSDLPTQTISRYYLRTGELNGGLPLHIPVFVARGTSESLETGQRLSVSGSIHGDELNPVRVVQRIFEGLQDRVATLNGTVIGIPTVNPVGIYLNQRNYFTASSSGFLTNVNRVFPGVNIGEDGGTGPEFLAYSIWNNLWGKTSNVDVGIDFHTVSTGSDGPLWCYADTRLPGVERLATLLEPDILKIDPGEPGSIETTFVDHRVPAITVEIGSSKVWQPEYISRSVAFANRLMEDLYILPHEPREPYAPNLTSTYVATTFASLPARYGGFLERLVNVSDDVVEGQAIANVRNSFGDILEVIRSPVVGRVLQAPRDPTSEPGESVATLVYNATSATT